MSANCFWEERQNPLDHELEALENFWNNVVPGLPGVRRLNPNEDRKRLLVGGVGVDDMSNLWSPLPIRQVN